uniref:Uncharacterized protein n=1 Tax=Arundo donax TaxID=35708 RepID=A0A0A9BAM4_ARUDO
MHWLQTCNP